MTRPDPPFRSETHDGVTLIHAFDPHLRRRYADLERELPCVRDAVAALVAAGHARFVFGLRSADASSAYPVVKWGAIYGALCHLRRRYPDAAPERLRRGIALAGGGELFGEIRDYHFDRIFPCYLTAEAALSAMRLPDGGVS